MTIEVNYSIYHIIYNSVFLIGYDENSDVRDQLPNEPAEPSDPG